MKTQNILGHWAVSYIKALLLFFLLFTGTNSQAQTYCPCVVPGFLYRAPVVINNSCGFALSGYQVVINVNWNAHMNADFSDLRFRDYQCTDLSYYVETYTASTTAKVWVKVPSVPVGGATIYMYYGNTGAVTASNSQTTFDFFDDFSDGNYTANPPWTVGGSTYSVISGYLQNNSSLTTINLYSTAINIPSTIGVMMEYDAMWTSTWCIGNELYLYDAFGTKVLQGFNEYCDFNGSHNLSVSSNINSASIVNPPAINAWNHYKVSAFNGTYKIDYNNGTASATTTGGSTLTASKIRIGGWQDQSGSRFDNIRVRHYAVPEPICATGTEENDANNNASVTPASDTVCAGQSSTFTASAGIMYHWSSGDTTAGITVVPPATTTYTVTVTSASVCTATAMATLTINLLPTVNAGSNQTVCSGAPTSLSGSGTSTYSWDHGVVNGIPFTPLVTTTYSVTGTDTNGCSNTALVTVAVDSNLVVSVNPTAAIICAGTGEILTASGASSYRWTPGFGLSDTTGSTVTASPPLTMTYTIIGTSGACSDTTSVYINVNDTVNPTIACPLNITAMTNAGCTATGVALGIPVTNDNCTVASTTNNAPPIFPLGNTTVTWTVADGLGNTAICNQIVTVNDTVNPVITCPANITTMANTGCTATGVALGTPITSDNCSVTSVTNSAPPAFPSGNTIVVWTVTDGAGNTAMCNQTVTVSDSINPVIVCPFNITTMTNTGCTATGVVLGTPVTNDNCVVASVANNAPSTFSLGNTAVLWTVTDGAGNSAVCNQIITVNDNVNPLITCPANITTSTNTGCTATGVALGTPVTSDNCSVASVINNAPSVFPFGNTTVAWTVTDGAGNTAQCNQVVTVNDHINPIITCPSNITTLTNSGCTATGVSLGMPVTSDNCSVALVNNNAPSIFQLGNTIVIWTVTDGSGNTAVCNQTVTVNYIPNTQIGNDTLICYGTTLLLSASGGTTYAWSTSDTTQSITVQPLALTTYSVTTSDGGCTGSASITINVYVSQAVDAGYDTTIYSGESVQLNASSGVIWNWSPTYGLSCSDCQSPVASPENTTTYSLTAKDNNGCVSTDHITVTVDQDCGTIFVPNIFSPNGDNHNDIFYIRGKCIVSMTFIIYDRWGDRVFTSSNPLDGWDGSFNGKPLDEGVFSYYLNAKLNDNTKVIRKGTITLVR